MTPPLFSRKGEISRFGAICGGLRPRATSCPRLPVARNRGISRVSVISCIGLDFCQTMMYLISSLVEISSCAQGIKSTREKCSRGAPRCADLAHVGVIPLKPCRRFSRRHFSFRGGNLTFGVSGVDYMALFENATIPLGVKGYADGDSLRQLFRFRAFIDIGTSRAYAHTRTRDPPPTGKNAGAQFPVVSTLPVKPSNIRVNLFVLSGLNVGHQRPTSVQHVQQF